MSDNYINNSYSDEIRKIRERTFTTEFKELVNKVLHKQSEEADDPELLLRALHELYYTVLSCAFDESVVLLTLQNGDSLTDNCIEELSNVAKEMGFQEVIVLNYDFSQNHYMANLTSSSQSVFKNFFLLMSDSLYSDIIDNPHGILLDSRFFDENADYSKRLQTKCPEDSFIWMISSYPIVNKSFNHIRFTLHPFAKLFCPILMFKVTKDFTIDEQIINKVYQRFFSLVLTIIINRIENTKHFVFNTPYYFHELYTIFETYWNYARCKKDSQSIIIKAVHEDALQYCLFKYLFAKLNTLKDIVDIQFRPSVGLMILFVIEQSDQLINELKGIQLLFDKVVKLKIVNNSEVKNVIQLYNYIVSL